MSLRRRFGDPLSTTLRWAVITAAIAGAALGSKLLFWLEDPEVTWQNIHNLNFLMGGKTIVGALIFGLISVEFFKRYVGVSQSTGDLYAIPLTLGIAIGRVGCFLTGLPDNTYGTPTNLPWAVDFGDGIPRHPTQLYEITFLLILVSILYRILKRSSAATGENLPNEQPQTTVFTTGDTFKFFMVAYLAFRLMCDFIKPYSRILFGLQGIQWACLLVLLYYSPDIARWLSLREKRG